MPAVPGGTEIGTVYVAAPMALTLNWPARLIAGGVSAQALPEAERSSPAASTVLDSRRMQSRTAWTART
jgi:hypothetical protein